MTLYNKHLDLFTFRDRNIQTSERKLYISEDHESVLLDKTSPQELETSAEEKMIQNLVIVEKHRSWKKTPKYKRFTNTEVQESLIFLNEFTTWLFAQFLNKKEATLIVAGFRDENGIEPKGGIIGWRVDNQDKTRVKRFKKAISAINAALKNTDKTQTVRKKGYGKYSKAARQIEKLFNDDKICGDFIRLKTGDAYQMAMNVLKSKAKPN